MLKNNLQTLRKQRGYSQETLAEKLNVVRQTVSKWEKGLSVPDAELLQRLAEIFEVSVGELLGEDLPSEPAEPAENEIARQLALLNDRLAEQSARSKQHKRHVRSFLLAVGIGIVVSIALYLVTVILFGTVTHSDEVLKVTSVTCELDGETYDYSVVYDENYQIRYAGGDAFIANHVNTEQYSDANILLAQIEDYFTEHGGEYEEVVTKRYEDNN